MERQTTINRPVLLLDLNGYRIETVLVGRYAKYTAWILLRKTAEGSVLVAASGWAVGYENALTEAARAHLEVAAGLRAEADAR